MRYFGLLFGEVTKLSFEHKKYHQWLRPILKNNSFLWHYDYVSIMIEFTKSIIIYPL